MINHFSEIAERLETIKHLCGPTQGEWLFNLVKGLPDGATISEVGVFYGYITAVLALASIGSSRRVLSIDHMIGGMCDYAEGSKCVYLEVLDNLDRMGVLSKVAFFPMKSEAALPMIKLMGKPIDLLYLDGDHNEEPVLKELRGFDDLIPVGGMVCGDDCLPAEQEWLTFTDNWNKEDVAAFAPEGVGMAVWRFFRGNSRYEVLPDVPGNQFGFRKVK